MKNVTIRTKLLFLVGLFAVGFATYSVIVFMKTAPHLEDSEYAEVQQLQDFTADIMPPPTALAYLAAIDAESHVGDHAALTKTRERVHELVSMFDKRRDTWAQRFGGTPLGDMIAGRFVRAASDLLGIIETELVPALDSGDASAIAAAKSKAATSFLTYSAAVTEVVDLATTQTTRRASEAAATISTRKMGLAVFAFVLVMVCAVLGILTARGISKRLAETADLLKRVAAGDYSERIDAAQQDEIGKMATSLNSALESVDSAFCQVRDVAIEMASAATTLAASSEQISSGAQEQAASLEETAASLEEITATVKQSAGNAQQASQLATSSRETAETGGSIVGQAVIAMNEVNQASRRIGDIITTIDEIALQTNLLALNAAVEAARAGEQGRGFAVVAAEVGNLAQRSATAAKEVKSLITDTLARVEAGHTLVGQSGNALTEIIASVKKVTDIFGEIAAAAREQSAGVDQVNEAVAQMDRVTQSNSAQTSELSRTAESLSSQASQLHELLAKFTLSAETAAREPVRPSKPRPTTPAVASIAKRAPRKQERESKPTFNRIAVEGGDSFEVL